MQLAAYPRGTGSDLWYTWQVSAIHPEGHLTSQSRLCLQFHTWPTANRCNSNFFFSFFLFKHIFLFFPKSTLGGLQSTPTIKNQTFKSNLNWMVSFYRCFFYLLLEKILSTQRNDFSCSYICKRAQLQLEKQTCRGQLSRKTWFGKISIIPFNLLDNCPNLIICISKFPSW